MFVYICMWCMCVECVVCVEYVMCVGGVGCLVCVGFGIYGDV